MTAGGWEEEYESGAEEYERWAREEYERWASREMEREHWAEEERKMEQEHWAEEEREMSFYMVETQKGTVVYDRDFLNLQLSPDNDEWETWMSARRDLFCRAADARYLKESGILKDGYSYEPPDWTADIDMCDFENSNGRDAVWWIVAAAETKADELLDMQERERSEQKHFSIFTGKDMEPEETSGRFLLFLEHFDDGGWGYWIEEEIYKYDNLRNLYPYKDQNRGWGEEDARRKGEWALARCLEIDKVKKRTDWW